MAVIALSKGFVALVDDDDYARVSQHKWWLSSSGHVYTQIARKTVMLHRFIIGAIKGQVIDHINRNRLDNRRENLRFCTQSQNCANAPSRRGAPLGFRGVARQRRAKVPAYRAVACKDGVSHVGPLRRDPISAARDYDAIAKKLHGEFASLNFSEVAS